jgi:hypothetical protein
MMWGLFFSGLFVVMLGLRILIRWRRSDRESPKLQYGPKFDVRLMGGSLIVAGLFAVLLSFF